MRNVGHMKKFIKEESDENTVDEVEPPVVQGEAPVEQTRVETEKETGPKSAKEMLDHPT